MDAPLAQADNLCRIDKYPKFSGISFVRLIFSLLTATRIFAISLRTDKSSCRNFAKLSSWWARRWRKRIFFISFVACSDNKKHSFECFSIQIYVVCVKRRGIEKLAHRYSQTVCKHNHGFQSNVFGASLHNAFYRRKRNSAQYCKSVLSDIFLFKILT